MQVNMFQAKTDLSKLIASLERKEHDEIYIARDGKPVAVLTLFQPNTTKRQLGKFNGKYSIPEDFDEENDEIYEMMSGVASDEYFN